MDAPDQRPTSAQSDFARLGQAERTSFVSDFLYLLKTNRKWWMLPLICLLLAFGVLMILASTGAAPFIYTLF
ncbi:MAG: DUF5989 family protein [Phycisphaerae bacterium]